MNAAKLMVPRIRLPLSERLRLAIAALLFSALTNVAPAQEPHPPLADLVYGRAGNFELKLDLYQPSADHAPAKGHPAPVIVFVHGGGWKVGDKAEAKAVAGPLNAAGFAVASINYRLSGDAIFPAQIIDCKTAVRWLRANAARYGLDPKRIGVLGFSAGGHLAALLGTSDGVKTLEDRGQGNPGESSRVQAVCMVSGPVDLTLPTRSIIGKISVAGELGGPAVKKPELARQANPITYLRQGKVAPFFVIQGDQDKLVTTKHAELLVDALRHVGGEVTVVTVRGGEHVPFGDEQRESTIEFFQRHLGSR